MADQPLLELRTINTFYGPVQAHFDLSLHVQPGEIVCLLGGNASGKSTAMKEILGLVRPRSGQEWLDGQEATGWGTPKIIQRGVWSVREARPIFTDMQVR